MSIATDAQVQQWREQGWVLLPGLVPTDEIDAALDDVWRIFPHPDDFAPDRGDDTATEDAEQAEARRSGFLAGISPRHRLSGFPAPPEKGPAFRTDQFLARQIMPVPGLALNRLVVADGLLDFAERALDSSDIRLYQMGVWAKYTGVTDYEQPMHQDQNHSVVPFRPEPGWWHLEGFLYLTDVDEDVAPTRAVGLRDSGGRQVYHHVAPDEDPGLYEAEVSLAGPRGSYLAYRPDVFHRGVNLTRPGGARVLYNISYKLAGQDWIGFESPQARSNTPWFKELVASCTPRQLAVLGVPEPGHPYWTPAMLELMAVRYPGLDLTPWSDALDGGGAG